MTAPALVTAGPYAYVRNPLYVGNFITALGFALAFTGELAPPQARPALGAGSLGIDARRLRSDRAARRVVTCAKTSAPAFDEYVARVPRLVPRTSASQPQAGAYDPSVIARGRDPHLPHLRRDAGRARLEKSALMAAHAHGRSAPLRTALVLTAAVAALELAGGIAAHSLALVADSAHVFMDALALGIALVAGAQALRPATMRQTLRIRAHGDPGGVAQRRRCSLP